MKILAIDTSCDETSVAVSDRDCLLSNIISSQIEFHKKWGGVVPLLAKRNHEERIDMVIKQALQVAKTEIKDIDVFAVTCGPGLAVALEVGIRKVKQLARNYQKPVVAVDHMAGHLYANFAKNRNGNSFQQGVVTPCSKRGTNFPILSLLISGGHTEIILINAHMDFKKIGWTLDDSIGEAFDKVANMLGLGYPGGPIIEELAKQGNENRFDFPIAMKNSGDLNFSYSGLKTAVLRVVKDLGKETLSKFELRQELRVESGVAGVEREEGRKKGDVYQPSLSKKPIYKLNKKDIVDICASFQKSAYKQLELKVLKAVEKYPTKYLLIGGGVVANLYIRSKLRKALKQEAITLVHPGNNKLFCDNAGMISIAGYYMARKKMFTDPDKIDRMPRLSL